jgi:hypothetical protein
MTKNKGERAQKFYYPMAIRLGVKIRESYDNTLRAGEIKDNMALYDINPVLSIDINRLSAI